MVLSSLIRSRFVDWSLPAVAAAIGLVFVPTLSGRAAAARDAVALVYPPWTGQAAALDRALSTGGRLVALGRLPFVVIVRPEGGAFAARVAASGAWLRVAASAAAGCAPAQGRPT